MYFDDIEILVRKEYDLLIKKLDLTPLTLDIYLINPKSKNKTQLGTPYANATPLYTPEKIILPLNDGDIDFQTPIAPQFPPANWNKLHNIEWPIWRIELWHEVCHQVEDQIIGEWKPGHEHGKSWKKALQKVATMFKVNQTDIENVI